MFNYGKRLLCIRKSTHLIAAGLGLYGNEKIENTNVQQYHCGIGRNRHWRVTYHQQFELSERSEVFDRWALSKRASAAITNQLDSTESFVKMVDKLEMEILAYERSQIKSIFESALERIASNKDNYICIAIGFQKEAHVDYETICNKLIHDRIGNIGKEFGSYEGWIKFHHPKLYGAMNCEDFKQGRILWLKSLVEEFS